VANREECARDLEEQRMLSLEGKEVSDTLFKDAGTQQLLALEDGSPT
jgi:hypothetical protein